MSWLFLFVSGIFEISGILIFKKLAQSKGKQFVLWFLILGINFAFSLMLLSLAMREIDMSIAYAVWTGIGASGGVIMAGILYKESLSWQKILSLVMIIGSMVGLKLMI